MVQEREIEGTYALLMMANKLEVQYKAPTFSILLEPHGGLVHMHIIYIHVYIYIVYFDNIHLYNA